MEMKSDYIERMTEPGMGMEGVPQMESYEEALEWYRENQEHTYANNLLQDVTGGIQEELDRTTTEAVAVQNLLEDGNFQTAEKLVNQYFEEAKEEVTA